MSSIADKAACELAGQGQEDGLLPVSPFTALQVHFGMLLGVDDLETLQSYPRGKIRLHNAWLHGEGVVWGFNVFMNKRRELEVSPGLGLDAAGRELHLDAAACLDLGKWYEKHKDDADFTFEVEGAAKRFTAHVVAKFRACLTRQVPAVADPCSGAETDTAYSRAFETVDLLLRPGRAPEKVRPYHRLRVLFAIEADSPAYADAAARRTTIQGLPPHQQPAAYLKAFREFAGLDVIDLKPQTIAEGQKTSIFPEDPAELVLADILDIRVAPGANAAWALADPLPMVEVTMRPALVATSTIQELLCGPVFAAVAARPPPLGPPDAGGPRFDRSNVSLTRPRQITLTASSPLDPGSVAPEAFSVRGYDSTEGWNTLEIRRASADAAGTTLTLDLREDATAPLIRIVARGTGDAPLLGQNQVPLAGAIGDPPGSADAGNDFVFMLRRS